MVEEEWWFTNTPEAYRVAADAQRILVVVQRVGGSITVV